MNESSEQVTPARLELFVVPVMFLILSLQLGWRQLSAADQWLTYGVLFVPYAWVIWRREHIGRRELFALVPTAVLARFVLVFAPPVFSDDIYRYVWDGRVAAAGINPFEYAPTARALESLRDSAIWPAINHAEVPTIYPPGAQFLFEANAHLGGGVAGMKLWMVGLEVLCVVIAVWWSRQRGVRWQVIAPMTALYALNPLVIVEGAHSGHIDLVAWSFLGLALILWRDGDAATSTPRSVVVVLLVGLSAATKFLSLLVLPFFMLEQGARADTGKNKDHSTNWWVTFRRYGKGAAMCIGVVAIVAVSYTPYLSAGAKLFDGFGTYAASWRSNDGGYRAVRAAATGSIRSAVECPPKGRISTRSQRAIRCGDDDVLVTLHGLDSLFLRLGWTKQWEGETLPDTTWSASGLGETIAKGVAVFLLGLVMLGALMTGASTSGGLLAVLLTLYLFAPVVHPWYVAWLVPLTVLTGRRVGLVFSAAVIIAYVGWWSSQTGGEWFVPTWAVGVEYLAVAAAAWWDLVEDRPSTG